MLSNSQTDFALLIPSGLALALRSPEHKCHQVQDYLWGGYLLSFPKDICFGNVKVKVPNEKVSLSQSLFGEISSSVYLL